MFPLTTTMSSSSIRSEGVSPLPPDLLELSSLSNNPPVFNINTPEALMNDLILENVFRSCTREECSELRLTCKHWYKTYLPVWLQTGPPLKLILRNEQIARLSTDDDRHELSEFLQEFHQGSSQPPPPPPPAHNSLPHRGGDFLLGIHQYRKFDVKIQAMDVDVDLGGGGGLMNGFWNDCGGWMTHLKIELDYHLQTYCSSASEVVTLVETILSCSTMPSLEQLHFKICLTEELPLEFYSLSRFEGCWDHRSLKRFKLEGNLIPFPVDWLPFLNHYPNLEKLVLKPYEVMSAELPRMLRAMKHIRQNDNTKLQKLKSLSWYSAGDSDGESEYPPASEIYELLRDSQLELTSLGIHFSSSDTETTPIHQVLGMFAGSLRKLKFYRSIPLEKIPLSGGAAAWEHMEALVLGGHALPDLSFLNHLPSLRSLKLEMDSSTEGADWMIVSSLDSPELQEGACFPSISEILL